MDAFSHVSEMYDVALKPRLLRTLITDHLPDEKHPFLNPSELSRVVSMIRTHRLLTEAFTDDMDQKQIGRWKSAVDTWVDCILNLTSSDMINAGQGSLCWGLLAKSAALLVSLNPTLSGLRSCYNFYRLSGFPNVKKNGSSFAAKVVQPVLKLLNDDNSQAIWEGALHLLCTIMTSFPFAVQRNYDSVESAFASKLLSGGCSQYLLKV